MGYLEQIHVLNFKSIKAQTLDDLTPIVGIWGGNGSGKSSLLQAIIWVLKNNGSGAGSGINIGGLQDYIFGHNPDRVDCKVAVTLRDFGKQVVEVNGYTLSTSVTVPTPYNELRYFPPWRHIVDRDYPIQKKVDVDLGIAGTGIHTFMHYYLHRLLGEKQRGDKKASETYDKINNWAEKIGFGPLLDDTVGSNVKGTYFDEILKLEVPIFDGGYGGNSFLPILLEGYSFTDGIMLVEEPEISLHPAAQSEVLDFFIEMAKERKHQIIFTSHSEYMVKKIARLLKGREVDSDLISVYVAKKEDEHGTMFEKQNNIDLVSRFDKGQDIILELTKRN